MSRNLFIIVPTLLIAMKAMGSVTIQGINHGEVHMQGRIVEAACAIEMNSREQTVDMEVIPLVQLMNPSASISRPFSIRFIKCVLERSNRSSWSLLQAFRITFDGSQDGDLLRVEGEAKGIGLKIIDEAGNSVQLGEAMPVRMFRPGDNELRYTMHLLSNNTLLRVGAFHSIVRFKMDYY